MTAEPTELDRLSAGIDELRDLFRRRLLDDRDKRLMIQQLAERADQAESRRESILLVPLVRQLVLVIDRMDQAADTDVLLASCTDELLDILAQQGFDSVPSDGPIDPSCHEVLQVEAVDGATVGSTPGDLEVARILRRGFRFDGKVLRPAQVVARRRVTTDASKD